MARIFCSLYIHGWARRWGAGSGRRTQGWRGRGRAGPSPPPCPSAAADSAPPCPPVAGPVVFCDDSGNPLLGSLPVDPGGRRRGGSAHGGPPVLRRGTAHGGPRYCSGEGAHGGALVLRMRWSEHHPAAAAGGTAARQGQQRRRRQPVANGMGPHDRGAERTLTRSSAPPPPPCICPRRRRGAAARPPLPRAKAHPRGERPKDPCVPAVARA